MLDSDEVLDLIDNVESEFRVLLAESSDNECARYLIRNKDRLIHNVVETNIETGEETIDVLTRLFRGIHRVHISGTPMYIPNRVQLGRS